MRENRCFSACNNEAIDNELVFKAIQIALSQFPLYLKQITDYLDSLEVKDA
ncbi:MAG UNVERIFIED_CONTAM: hypothetical protein LVR29_33945 [Microcystis novacekii LVE1205-3]